MIVRAFTLALLLCASTVASAQDAIARVDAYLATLKTLSADFDATKYHDEYREQLLALIDKKAAGEVIETGAPVEASAPVIDLMAALEASLQRASGGEDASADASDGTAEPKKKRAPRKRSA